MTSLRDAIKAKLENDAELMDILTGGVHEVEISKSTTLGAYDANEGGRLKPCCVVRLGTSAPTGPVGGVERQFITLWFYQARGYAQIDAAIARCKALLDRQQVAIDGGFVYEVRHAGDMSDTDAPELEGASLKNSRYSVVLIRSAA
jgi:hypothetical protein